MAKPRKISELLVGLSTVDVNETEYDKFISESLPVGFGPVLRWTWVEDERRGAQAGT